MAFRLREDGKTGASNYAVENDCLLLLLQVPQRVLVFVQVDLILRIR